ncbi:chromosome transmission fidelity protein 18 [Lindgomyces ingoldianus]|uniref:Chromosome transmission fidelity protein 18 n=1 Tax=Lindgomyces ingoldianus TaxID=673940 RepID=A0ACB6R0N1_9PLEO|nr:chromosome transmission fidelity protein 18 [Lindgomyces ingoldianus]KAF2472798.1 chromosome transmission fidelity protein 18 [Lindgomyces ingoldianus]
MSTYSPQLPTSFDPAIHLHSEFECSQDAPLSLSVSDDLEALQQCIDNDKIEKNKQGIVIQHRAWNTAEVFRSEEDYSIDTPLRNQKASPIKRFPTGPTLGDIFLPSSPPNINMPLTSSPVAYPPSSSPLLSSPKKRKRADPERSPLKDVHVNQPAHTYGGFVDDSDDEDDRAVLKEAANKRRAISSIKDLLPIPNPTTEYTPPASQDESILDPEDVPVDHLNAYFNSPSPQKLAPVAGETTPSSLPKQGLTAKIAAGKCFYIPKKFSPVAIPYEQLIASRSETVEGRAKRSFYGIDIHRLIDDAKALDKSKALTQNAVSEDNPQPSIESTAEGQPIKSSRTLMWTEKYRAKKFTDLVGDERTHRSVLRWLKGWDPIVFPGSGKAKQKSSRKAEDDGVEQKHRKVLLLTGPPGLGKTTLAHVCARQAGYEVQEINASDERSRDVVKGRIRDMVGTENVRGVNTTTANGKVRKAGKPVCVVVDEVDGVVSGSGGSGEGGFVKALIDLITLDERNSKAVGQQNSTVPKKKRKGDKFRLMRPLILICNDVYHPSLRPLRQSSFAEIIHIRKPALNMVVSRIQDIFVKEAIPCDSDGVRRLCEATWGVSTKKEGGTGSGTGEGDIRSVMVVSEWVAGKLRASTPPTSESMRLTRKWVEDNVINDLHHGGGAARSLGRGGTKDIVERVFREGAGFPKQAETTPMPARQGKQGVIGVAEAGKRRAMDRLREMVNTSGDCDRIIADCFSAYPEKPFQDDTLLTKPTAAYEWLHFHDTISSAVHGSQEWELAPYLSQSVLAFHHLFASPRAQSSNQMSDPDAQPSPFSGPNAGYMASEQQKASRAQLMALQSTLSLHLTRIFRSPQEIAIELLPYALRMLSPDIKPVLVNTGPSGSKSFATASVRKASEKVLVKRSVDAMTAIGVTFEKSRVELEDVANRSGGWVYRMEPPLDQLGAFETLEGKKDEKVRFAVRSVLESEWKRESVRIDGEARRRRGGQGNDEALEDDKKKEDLDAKLNKEEGKDVKRDFFGRVIKVKPLRKGEKVELTKKEIEKKNYEARIWVSFHEGFSNAVRKPITVDELMRGL